MDKLPVDVGEGHRGVADLGRWRREHVAVRHDLQASAPEDHQSRARPANPLCPILNTDRTPQPGTTPGPCGHPHLRLFNGNWIEVLECPPPIPG